MRIFVVVTLFVSIAMLVNCKKRQLPPSPDIEFDTLVPGITLSSVRSSTIDTHHGCLFFRPKDSTVYREIDLDKNGQPDFKFKYSHQPSSSTAYCPGFPCSERYVISMEFIPIHKDCFIAIQDSVADGRVRAKQLVYGNDLHNSLVWRNSDAWVFFTDHCGYYSPFYYPAKSEYLGLKVNNRFGWLYLEPGDEKIVIRSLAFNHVENNAIRVGHRN
jgi:hypothetical protein